ncbi:hypothetical protein BGW41_005685 [Actinomortierella wolfii]|nr:hypothetical protein BGW41_005685 [Actinomortierella wolfii]
MASSAPNAADTRASSAPPSSSSIPPLGSNPSTTAAAASSSQGSTATDNSKAQEAASTQPPPYSYTPVLPWTNPLQQTLLQPYQYVIVNGMPYLMPAGYMPFFQQQQHHHHQQQAIFGYPMAYGSMMVMNADGSTTFVNSHMTHDQLRTAATGTGVTTASVAAPGAVPEGGAGAGEAAPAVAALNPQEIAARDQRRAASIWLLMKLAFGVYLFGQNGSLERKVLLNIAALIIFLHQTGRLRIVRRIAPANLDDQANMDGNRQQAGAAQAGQDGGAGEAGPSGTRSADASSNNCPSTPSSSSATSSSAGEGLNQKAGGEGSSASANDNDTTQGVSSSSSSSATASAGDSSSRQTNINTQDQQPVVAPQERVSVWRNIEHALLTFVTSLVPAAPPEIDPAVANVAAAGERM